LGLVPGEDLGFCLVRGRGISALLVEQNARAALSIFSRAYVLESGRVILAGEAGSLLENPQVRKAYLAAEVFES